LVVAAAAIAASSTSISTPACPRAGTRTRGPALVAIVEGSLTYEDEQAKRCVDTTYIAGQGFVDRGFGHVHRSIAGPAGADFLHHVPPASRLGHSHHPRRDAARGVRLIILITRGAPAIRRRAVARI